MPTTKTNENKYTITADNRGGLYSLTFRKSRVPKKYIASLVQILSLGFQDILVVNDETGEVALNTYFNSEFFIKDETEGETLKQVEFFLMSNGIT